MSFVEDDDHLVLAHRTFSLSQCDVIISMLTAYGIEAHAFDREFNSNNGHILLATGGYRIMVRETQIAQARLLLKPFVDAKPELPESAAFKKRPLSNGIWLFFCMVFGVWAPSWLRRRD